MGQKINNVGVMLNNPKQRNIYLAGAGLAILTIIVGGFYATRNKNDSGPAGAQVGLVPQVNAVPGTSTSVRYNEMVNQSNVQEAEKALKEDKTFVATPVNTNSANTENPFDALDKQIKAQREKEAPEQAIREQEEKQAKAPEPVAPVQPVAPVVQPIQQVVVQQAAPAKKYGSDEDYMLISTLSGSWNIKASKAESDFAGSKGGASLGNAQQVMQQNQVGQQVQQQAQKGRLIAKAGTIYNAVLETGINSDEPSPVLAKIVGGELKGTRLIGRMTTSGEKVVVEFGTASVPNMPSSIRLNSVAVDPATSRTGLATDVDRHTFLRYGVLLGAAFLGGYADAIAQQNTTSTVTPQGSVVTTKGTMDSKQINQQAIGSVGKELANQTRTTVQTLKPTITVDAGTAIGILIMEDLYDNLQ
jgi:type IV secretory pathway VirB10-like protein